MTIWTAEVIEKADLTREWVSGDHPESPTDMDSANGWRVGWYAIPANDGDTGTAWGWDGPFRTKAEAEAAVAANEATS